ncbi:MAG: LacI family DNA-binding transcriptional regulator [Wenzhouxiangellaceae bacterium]
MKRNRVIIDDVARLAGVSIKTVSRVLNQEPNVRAATREKVQLAVEQLNYQPSLSARSLAGDRSHLIGLLYDNPSVNYIAGLQEGTQRRCRQSGYHLIAEPVGHDTNTMLERVAMLQRQLRIDGVILTPPVCDNQEVIDLLNRHHTPFVLIAPEHNHSSAACVLMDDLMAAYDMTAYLIRLGHRNIAFIKGHPDHGASHLRYQGFRKAMKEHQLSVPRGYVRQGYFSYRSGMNCAEKLLSLEQPPTAIFASNDDMAAGVMAAAHRHGIQVPETLSVAGFDDSPVASVIWPQLSTIRQPMADMAATATELLISQLSSGNREPDKQMLTRRYLDFELVLRGSCAPPNQTGLD